MKGLQYLFPFGPNKFSIISILIHLLAYSVIIWIFLQTMQEGFQSPGAVTPQPGLSGTQIALIVVGIIIFAFYPPSSK